MNELKLIVGDDAQVTGSPPPDLSKLSPIDALNRRDIELIKRSLTTMQKDCKDIQNTIMSLHARHSRMPSKGFFVTSGALVFVVLATLTIARPQLNLALQHVPAVAKLTTGDVVR